MGKRGRALTIAVGVALLAFFAGMPLYSPAPEPVYQGKPLSYWLAGLGGTDHNRQLEAANAVHAIGTNAIPTLLRMLRAQDSALKTKWIELVENLPAVDWHITDAQTINNRAGYGFGALGTNGAGAIPELIKMLNENVSDHQKTSAAASLGAIGPPSRRAIPALLETVRTSTNEGVRGGVFQALGAIHEDPDEVLPALIQGLGDFYPWNRASAAMALGRFGEKAKAAIPALVSAFHDPALKASKPQLFNDVQSQIGGAINRIDPETFQRVVNSPSGFGQ